MKKLLVILSVVLISSPLSALLSNLYFLLIMTENDKREYYQYYSFGGDVFSIALYEIPIYIIVGIPVTFLIDFIIKKFKLNQSSRVYLIQLFMYMVAAGFFGSYLFLGSHNIEIFLVVLIAVLTYFHILVYFRKLFLLN
ncbi:hypothetical protein [Neobacillus sp. 19]|uniref:hypothetical protein n=1 Tax=Neobacillus sp. 19 TaxID=3394458 RepID=UPI003BF7142E